MKHLPKIKFGFKAKVPESIASGFGFGTSSGVITTLGLIVGVYSSSADRIAVIGSVLTISIADALSDALGGHISEESKKHATEKDVRYVTISTFLSKLITGLSFVVPFMLLPISSAVIASIVYSALVLVALSLRIAKNTKQNKLEVVFEHLIVGLAVVVITYVLGQWVDKAFGNNSL